jgi:cardiolipin synthase A/B
MGRAVAGPRIEGNALKIQFDGPNTFDAWVDAIGRAERYVHFENYIIRDDRVGRIFRDALVERARAGVEVRVLYDWVGCWATPRRYWKPLREAGVEVRAFNRPTFRDPLGILQRDHRKLVCVDGTVAFIGGLCVGDEWAGSGDLPPWRDTGVEIRGPAAAASARTFERIWEEIGDPVPEALRADPGVTARAGSTPVWLIEGVPWRSRVYRTQQLVAASASERIWITDPYFVAPRPVAEALTAAALDGVDVRILVPAHNNWPWVGSLSRGGYRYLLEAGVRIFEWQGPMIHAKTSVSDGIWSRIGSSNLNAASLLGNWEIDLGILDRDLARQMEGLFLADLASSVEIILPGSDRVWTEDPVQEPSTPPKESLDPEGRFHERLEQWLISGGSSGIRIADLVRAGSSLGDAMAGHRVLGREDRAVLGTLSILVIVAAGLAAFFPRAFAWTLAFLLAWLGIAIGIRAVAQAKQARALERKHRKKFP